MEIVIDIPKEYYETLKEMSDETISMEMTIIKYGKPLPEKHGRIIDESKINKVYAYKDQAIANNIKAIGTIITGTDAPTIIEADKGSEE